MAKGEESLKLELAHIPAPPPGLLSSPRLVGLFRNIDKVFIQTDDVCNSF